MYPATTADLRVALLSYPHLAERSDAELELVLERARGEIELAAPTVAESVSTERLDRAAWSLHLDLALWHLRLGIERTSEGLLSDDLRALRQTLDTRLSRLAQACAAEGRPEVTALEGLGEPPQRLYAAEEG